MEERTRKKHLRALRYGIMYLEGHKAEAIRQKQTAQDVVTSMQVALSALGFEAVAKEGFYDGVKSGSERVTAHYEREMAKLKTALAQKTKEAKQATTQIHVFPADATTTTNNDFEPQDPNGFNFRNIGLGCPKEV